MKHFLPFVLAIFLTACAVTPEDQQAVHQRQLDKEARENFITLKSQEHPGRPVVLNDDLPPPTPTPKPRRFSFLGGQSPAPAPAVAPTAAPRSKENLQASAPPPAPPAPRPFRAANPPPKPAPAPQQYVAARPKATPTPTSAPRYAAAATPRLRRNLGDTVYYWEVPPPSSHLQPTPHQQAAEAKYARLLAKRPENLTPEERLWAHEHY